jgi:DNA-binding response OmpR family regulator
MAKASIVIVEDEEDILELLEYNLQKEGYETIGFLNTKNVAQLLEEESIDLLLMDRNLPGVEGSEFVEQIRIKGIQTPVIYLSAKNKDSDIEEGFDRGADDYITKPFSPKEVAMRVKAVLKRTMVGFSQESISFRDINMNPQTREVKAGDLDVELSKLEFDLLLTFIQNKNSVLERDYLLKNVWGDGKTTEERTVNVAIKRLKEKIDPTRTHNYIKTIRGIGYSIH